MSDFEPKYNTLVQIYGQSIAKFGDRPLFGTKVAGQWEWMTYGEFGERVDAARGGLAALGIANEKGDRVAVIANNRYEWAVMPTPPTGSARPTSRCTSPSSTRTGSTSCAIVGRRSSWWPTRSIRDRIDQLPQRASRPRARGRPRGRARAEGHHLRRAPRQGPCGPPDVTHPDPDDVAGFIYTSGTTGNPKGVLLTHRNLANNVSAMEEVFPMSTDDRSLSFLPWAHSFGQVVELHGLFLMGASMAIAEAVDKIVDNLGEVKPTLLFSVPRIFNRIYDGLQKRMAEEGGVKKKLFDAAMANEQRRKELAEQGKTSGIADFKHNMFDKLVFSKVRERFGGRLKYAFSGGAAISREVAEFIDNLGIMVYEGYGLTETSPIATANWPGSRKIGSVGKPSPG
jgi:long-chain acyl-CoA synthetase